MAAWLPTTPKGFGQARSLSQNSGRCVLDMCDAGLHDLEDIEHKRFQTVLGWNSCSFGLGQLQIVT